MGRQRSPKRSEGDAGSKEFSVALAALRASLLGSLILKRTLKLLSGLVSLYIDRAALMVLCLNRMPTYAGLSLFRADLIIPDWRNRVDRRSHRLMVAEGVIHARGIS
jgi:hypothetical protein